MPRIDTLQQGNRIQPSSPVPIGSTGGARLQGEAIQGFGDQLSRAGIALAQFSTEADKEHNRVKLAALTEKARTAAIDARIAGETQFQKPDGSDQLEVAKKKYDELTAGFMDGFDTPLLKEQAATILNHEINNKAESIANSVIKRKVEAIKLDRDAVVGQRMSNIAADPFLAAQIIQENNKGLDESTGIFAPDEIVMRKNSEAKLFAKHAINTLISDKSKGPNRFDIAEDMINAEGEGQLSKYLGDKTDETLAEIGKARIEYTNQVIKEKHEQAKLAKEALRDFQDSNVASLYTILQKSKGPVDVAKVEAKALKMLENKEITPEGFKAAFATPVKDVREYTSDATRLNFTNEIDSGKSLAGMNERVMISASKGYLTSNDATGLIDKIAAIKKAKSSSNSTLLLKQYKIAENRIKQKAGGEDLFGTGELIVPGGKQAIANLMLNELWTDLKTGADPYKTSTKIIKKYVGEVAASDFVSTDMVPMTEQASYKSMQAYEPTFRKKYEELKKKGKTKDAGQQLQIWMKRKDALKDLEGEQQ